MFYSRFSASLIPENLQILQNNSKPAIFAFVTFSIRMTIVLLYCCRRLGKYLQISSPITFCPPGSETVFYKGKRRKLKGVFVCVGGGGGVKWQAIINNIGIASSVFPKPKITGIHKPSAFSLHYNLTQKGNPYQCDGKGAKPYQCDGKGAKPYQVMVRGQNRTK